MLEESKFNEAEPKKILHTYPLVQYCEFNEDTKSETVELCVTACEKHGTNYELASKMIKDNMDKKFGPSWHVVIGESFGFEVTYELKNIFYMFFAGNLAICIWKC